MEFAEPPEHQDLRKAIAAVTDQYGPQYFAERAGAGAPTTELWQDLGRHGFIGINFPAQHGGGDAGMRELAIVCEETAAHGCPLLLLLVSSAISGELLARYGSAEQRREWLPRMASGETKVVFAITEPNAGSNTRQIGTSAVRDGDDYLLNGTKYYISGVDEAEALIVVTRTAPERLSLFLVPTDAPGLVKHRLPVGISVPEKQFTLHFDNVRVPSSSLVGTEDEGFRQVFDGLVPERITDAAVKNVSLAAEICDGWLPIFYTPRLADVYNAWLDEGFARPGARRTRDDFEICATANIVITDDRSAAFAAMKPALALYMGGMGAEETNFHADVYRRMGYAEVVDDVTKLLRSGRREEAATAIPDELVDDAAIVGDPGYVLDQIAARETAGVTMMVVTARNAKQIHQLVATYGQLL